MLGLSCKIKSPSVYGPGINLHPRVTRELNTQLKYCVAQLSSVMFLSHWQFQDCIAMHTIFYGVVPEPLLIDVSGVDPIA